MFFCFCFLFFDFFSAIAEVHSYNQTQFYQNHSLQTINFAIETGYITVDSQSQNPKANNQFFYQLILKEANNKMDSINPKDPLILWLEGGPGCSSQMSLYESIGPFRINDKMEITLQQYSWNKQAHLLFVDQPFGAGLSWSFDLVDNTALAAVYFADFLEQFFESHLQFLSSPFYIFGQGYGGHFVPAIAKQLFLNEQLLKLQINYQGIGIGDPWISSFHQTTYYASYLFSVGLVDPFRRDDIQHMTTKLQLAILNSQWAEAQELQFQVSDQFMRQTTANANPFNFKQYNATSETKQKPFWDFINNNKQQFHIPDFIDYQDCNDTVDDQFKQDTSKSYEDDIVFMLGVGRVLLYNGQLDYCINIPGTLVWINQMKWDSIPKWKATSRKNFTLNQILVGRVKSYSNFSFVTIYKAGSKVPIDRPDVAYSLFKHFIFNDTEWNT